MKIKLQWLMAILLCICCGCGKTQDREAVLKKELDKHIDSQFSSAVVVAEKAFIITKESDDVVMYVSKLLYQEEMDECFTAWYGNDNSITVGMESEDAYGDTKAVVAKGEEILKTKYPSLWELPHYAEEDLYTIIAVSSDSLEDREVLNELCELLLEKNKLVLFNNKQNYDEKVIKQIMCAYANGYTVEEFNPLNQEHLWENIVGITIGEPLSNETPLKIFDHVDDVTAESLKATIAVWF